DMAVAGFAGAVNTLILDRADVHSGSASLRLSVPATGYTGAAIRGAAPHDLVPYTALTFWAKASDARTLDVVGLGNAASDTTYLAEWHGVALDTAWTKYTLPIPLPAPLTAVSGVFHFAESADEGPYHIWLDDIRYETVAAAALGAPEPVMGNQTL